MSLVCNQSFGTSPTDRLIYCNGWSVSWEGEMMFWQDTEPSEDCPLRMEIPLNSFAFLSHAAISAFCLATKQEFPSNRAAFEKLQIWNVKMFFLLPVWWVHRDPTDSGCTGMLLSNECLRLKQAVFHPYSCLTAVEVRRHNLPSPSFL